MKKSGRTAPAMFSALCIAGIVTLFSQGGAPGPSAGASGRGRTVTLDPGALETGTGGGKGPASNLGGIVPLTLRKVVDLDAGAPSLPAGTTLRLR